MVERCSQGQGQAPRDTRAVGKGRGAARRDTKAVGKGRGRLGGTPTLEPRAGAGSEGHQRGDNKASGEHG